ncbi:gpW family head-tail joining protein [Paraburkholderia sp. BR14320]|uniref:gpW family head-tail joining protein n=1 Tax=unclassified Paraburkholderia TaxID=2615204 RepID=UPI0034CF2044
MAYFNQARTVLGNWSQEDLQAALLSAQQALVALQSGQRVVTASYGQGDGAQSVTYTQVSRGSLEQWILYLQGMTDPVNFAHPRRARLAIF